MTKFYLLFACCGGMLAVILGAFAAHGLKGSLSVNLLNAFETGVQYQMYHSLALLLLVLLYRLEPQPLLLWSAGAMVVGIIMFSGSLYALALTDIKWFGPVTPLGGLSLIIGWSLMVVACWRMSGFDG